MTTLRKSDENHVMSNPEAVVKPLCQVLADTFTLYTKTLNYHWNVEGPRFVGIHELTETHYKNMAESIDEIAERIRALGYYAPGSMKTFAKISQINEVDEENIEAQQMLNDLRSDHEKMIVFIKEAIAAAEENKDSTTADMLSERRDFHEQAVWMLRSLAK